MDKGISNIIAALIGAVATIIVGIIGPYGLLQRENSALQQENTSLQQENSELQEQTAEADNSNLQSQISTLQSENAKLQESNSNLNAQIEALESEKEQLQEEIATLRNSTAFPESDNLDKQNLEESYNLLSVCPPYETRLYSSDIFKIGGISYTNSFRLFGDSFGSAYAYFNLNGEYQSLSFDIGHPDGDSSASGPCYIYLDGELVSLVEVNPNKILESYTIPLNGALQMRIEVARNGGSHGFVHAVLNT